MAIERDSRIKFHELGTLQSVTHWIGGHDEGLAEWLKNARRAYQWDRANVDEEHRAAVILLKDGFFNHPARIGLLDVGGASFDDVETWSTWQDPDASGRGSGVVEEITQGNGGKAYMFKCFRGPARILGVGGGRLNCKGFEGDRSTVERGTPGFMPDIPRGRQLPIQSWRQPLEQALEPFDVRFEELPVEVQRAISERGAFTLVEGIDPDHVYKGRIDADDLVHKLLRHDQSTIAVQQLRLYAMHNGKMMNGGQPLQLDPIEPHPGFEEPIVFPIPESLPDESGREQSTTLDGQRPPGRLILYTSRENMYRAYKELRARWKVTYRTEHQMIGSKPVSDFVPATPGAYFVYATVELSALEPDYVALGRLRPNDGPLVSAVDRFVAEKIRELAKEINDQRKHELDSSQLDEVHEENRRLDRFKNRFLPSGIGAGNGGAGEDGRGPREKPEDSTPREQGTLPESLEFRSDMGGFLRMGREVKLHLATILRPCVRDDAGRLVPDVELEWFSDDRHVAEFREHGFVVGLGKGRTKVWACVSGTRIESPRVEIEVWQVDHVLLTPRSLEIPLGRRKQVIAEVTNDDGARATNVFLNWEHDADDQMIVRIHPTGWVAGNRLGSTSISAGAGDPAAGGVWARIRAEVKVIENPDDLGRGGGFPRLLLTGRDIDPSTGGVRPGDPDEPVLWQTPLDFYSNIWWLNLESPAAVLLFQRRTEEPVSWRAFHAQKVVEMVIQVHMQEEFTSRGEEERKDRWVSYKSAVERYEVEFSHRMWEELERYVLTGRGLE